MKALPLVNVAALALAGCETIGSIPTEQLGSARLTLANGVPAGTAQLLGSGDTISLALAVTGITPGTHGFHLHTTGQCDRPDFTSAGGHLNPAGDSHGLDGDDGSHLGDLPNLAVKNSGTATTTIQLHGSRDYLVRTLFDDDGTAVVIHADPDDGMTDPSGNAGKRVACGVLEPN